MRLILRGRILASLPNRNRKERFQAVKVESASLTAMKHPESIEYDSSLPREWDIEFLMGA